MNPCDEIVLIVDEQNHEVAQTLAEIEHFTPDGLIVLKKFLTSHATLL